MVCNSLQVRVLIQDIVIDVQEKLERVLVQEMYLKDTRVWLFSLESCCLIVNDLCLPNCNMVARAGIRQCLFSFEQ